MKVFVIAFLALQALIQTNAQVIRTTSGQIISSSPIINPCASPLIAAPSIAPTIIQTNSVANSLADTLSLLTVSSLLAEALPLNPNVVAVQGCGCGLGNIGLGNIGLGNIGYYY